MKIIVPNYPFEDNMPMVKENFYRLGSVLTIMCVIDDGVAYCLEGSHRAYMLSQQDECRQAYSTYLVHVPKDHKFYFGHDGNYLVSEKNAPKCVKSDLKLETAWEVIQSFECKVEYDIDVDENCIYSLENTQPLSTK